MAQVLGKVVAMATEPMAGQESLLPAVVSPEPRGETDLPADAGSLASPDDPGIDPAEVALARVRLRPREKSKARTSRRARYTTPTTGVQFSGSGSDLRDPQPLDAAMGSWVRQTGVKANLTVAGLTGRWAEIVGELVASHVSADGYEQFEQGGGRLTVTADSPGWESTMEYQAETIKRRIREELGEDLVTEIVVRRAGRKKSGRWRVQSGRRR